MANSTAISTEENIILSMMQGMWQYRCLGLAVGFHIPEMLCNTEQQSLAIEDIATKLGCVSCKQIYTIMSDLASWGIGTELEGKRFAKNKAMELLRRDRGTSLGHFVGYHCSDEHLSAMRSLPECIKSGKPAFYIEHGITHYDYMNKLEEHPYDKQKMFTTALSASPVGSHESRKEFAANYHQALDIFGDLVTLPDIKGVNNLLHAFPWSTCNKIADVGGCTGHFLASIMRLSGCEHIQGYVVDLPHVVDDAVANIQRNKIPENRIQFVKHDFTEPFPSERRLDVDTIIVKEVVASLISNLQKTSTFLRNCRGLFPERGGRLVIIDGECRAKIGLNGLQRGWNDMHLLNIAGISFTSKDDWVDAIKEVATQAGYQFQHVYDTFAGGSEIIELSCK